MPRDDFSSRVKDRVAARAGHQCSICGTPTSGPSAESEDAITRIGVAAHITAAAPGGPRFDLSLSPSQRSSITNAIWLCAGCAKRIDDDAVTYTVRELHRIKEDAEARASEFRAAADARGTRSINVLALVSQAREAARADLAARWTAYRGSSNAVSLTLVRAADSSESTSNRTRSEIVAGDLVALLRAGTSILLRAPPGAGKTTTLLQIGSAALESAADAVPLFIRLADATRYEDLLQAAAHRLAFAGVDRSALATLATRGHLILLCDGWNEVDPGSRARLSAEFADLRAQAPHLGLAVTGRPSDPALSLRDSIVLEVGELTEPQQDAIARKIAGSPGEALLDRARRSTGLADLIENPFYLTALITTYAGGEFPSTKETILRAFVATVEAEKAALLQARLGGFHAEYLKALAVSLQKARRVSLDEHSAIASLFVAGETLVHRRLLRNAGEPRDALNALVDHHVLLRSGLAPDSSVGFQHQLFQEWYASFYVEQQMRDASAGDPGVSQQLMAESLNQPWWEEAVLFACERASRREEMLPTVAATIRSALTLDTRFAADIISRSSDPAWDLVRADVVSLVEKWLREGAVARALEFMCASGRPDFAEHVWPLISAPDQQRRLRALRCDRLTKTVLGSSAKERALSLPEQVASDVLGELCSSGGVAEFDFAVDIARQASPTMIENVAGALAFRGARSHLHALLRDAPPAVWDRMARTNHFDSILESGFAERLWSARSTLLASAVTPLERLRLRVLGATHPEAPSVRADVAVAKFPENLNGSTYELLAALSKRFLDEVRHGIMERVVAGRPIPSSCDTLLEGAICENPGLSRLVQDPATPWHVAEAVSGTLAEPLVSSLVDSLLSTLRREPSSTTWEQYHRLQTVLAAVPADRLVNVLAGRAPENSPDAAGALAELIARVGRDDEERRQSLSPDLKPKALPMLRAWADVMLGSADATGPDMVNVATSIGRSGWTELTDSLVELLDRDTARFRREREEQKLAFARGDRPILLPVSYGHQYADAIVGLAGPAAAEAMKARLHDREVGPDAARALQGIWRREMGVVHNLPSPRPFGAAAERRSSASKRSTQEPHPYVAAIIDAAVECCGESDNASRGRALELFAVAARMPYGNRGQLLVDAARRFSDHRNVIGLLRGLAAAGEILDSSLLVHRCTAEWSALRRARWDIDREWWRVDDFLQLLPFSDDPTAVLGVLAECGDLSTHSSRMSNVITALRDSPDERADTLLVEFARRCPAVTREHGWLPAISDRGSVAAAQALADFAFEADERPEQSGLDKYYFTKVLGTLLEKHSRVAEYLVRRLPELRMPMARSLVASALAVVADQNTVLALVEHEARVAPPGRGDIPRSAIEGLATDRHPDPSWPGAYSVLPRSTSALREALFTLALGNDEKARLAIRCLEYIDELRRDYGRPDDEPRHPLVGSGRPWPLSLATGPLDRTKRDL